MITNYVIPFHSGMVDRIVSSYINLALFEVMEEIMDKYMAEYGKSYVSVYDPDFQDYIGEFFPVNYSKERATDHFFHLYTLMRDDEYRTVEELVEKYLLAKVIDLLVLKYKKVKTCLPEKERKIVYRAAERDADYWNQVEEIDSCETGEVIKLTADEIMEDIENPEHYYDVCIGDSFYKLLDSRTEYELIEEGIDKEEELGLLRSDNSYRR